jgi:type VI secretion system protein ImpM
VSPTPAGCYGKLPIFADFIRHNYRSTEVEQLDQWFQEGIYFARQSIGGQWEAGYDKGPSFRFIFRPSGSPKFLIGAGAPGSDKVGRRYPFTIFQLVDAAPFERDAALLPVAFRSFLDPAQELVTKGWKEGDVPMLTGKIDRLPGLDAAGVTGHRSAQEAYLKRERASSFWTGVFGTPAHPGRAAILQNLQEAVRVLRATPVGRPSLGLKFPLPAQGGSEAASAAAAFWMDLSFRLVGWRSVPSLAFWHGGTAEAAPHLILFFTGTSPKNFPSLVLPDFDSETLWDLSRGGAAAPDRVTQVVNGPDLSMADLAAAVAAANKY